MAALRRLAAGVPARVLFLALNTAVLPALAAHFIVYLRYAFAAVTYPYELFEPEGIVWQQAMLIPGPRMYGDIGRFPFIVFHYPPVYHLVVRGLAELGLDPLAAGRGVSVLATLVTGGVVAALTFRVTWRDAGRRAAFAGGAVAGLTFFCFYPVVMMSPLMRSDTLAIALGFLGIWCVLIGGTRAWPLYAGMILFVLAAFTKQTCVIAPLASMAVLGLVYPRRVLVVCGFGLVLGGAALAVMTAITDGGFVRHLVLYNINRFSLDLLIQQIAGQSRQLIFLELAFGSLAFSWWRLSRGRGWRSLASFRGDLAASEPLRIMTVLTLYLGLSTLSLITLGKSGGGLNYFIEWMGLLSIPIGMLFATLAGGQPISGVRTTDSYHRRHGPARPGHPARHGAAPGEGHDVSALRHGPMVMAVGISAARQRPHRWTIAARGLVPLFMLAQIWGLPASRDFGANDPVKTRHLDALTSRVRDASKPVLSEDMVLLMRAGKEVPWEPAIFIELASVGRWDERLIIGLIESHAFAFVITRDEDDRYSAGLRHALWTAYPRTEAYGERTVHLPPSASDRGHPHP